MKKNKIVNIPRGLAANWGNYLVFRSRIEPKKIYDAIGDNIAWVSINEPDLDYQTTNPILDKVPNLKMSFWDITTPLDFKGEILQPPSDEDAKAIVDFILTNKDRNILVNCAAGVSRSGAVCRFCEDILGYEWLQIGKELSIPNSVLYTKMVNYYNNFVEEM